MKKRMKKLAGMLLAAVMTVGMLPNMAFADNKALPPSEGSLTIHKYLMEDLGDANLPNDGNEAGEGTNPSVPSTATPLDGITFNLYKITPDPTSGALPGDGPYTLAGTTMSDGAGATFTVAAASTSSVTTAGGGVAKASELLNGYYLVIEQNSDLVNSPAAPFVVPVPMTNPAGDGWIQDVHVYPKNESMSIEKEPTSTTSITIGDIMSYEIIPSVPTDIYSDIASEDANIKYSISDTLDSALDLDSSSLKVYGMTSKTGTQTLIPSSNYTESGDFKIEFNAAGRKLLFDNGYKFLTIKFSAVVNKGILTKPSKIVDNTAVVDFINKYSENKSKETPKVKIHSASIDIIKQDAKTNAKLKDAEFQIATSLAYAEAGKYLKKDAAGNIYDVGEDGYDTALEWIEKSAETTGSAKFNGIADYTSTFSGDPEVENKTYLSYYIVETKAPAGYNLLDDPVEVIFTASDSTETNSYTVTTTINNTTGFTLPKTGGEGTIWFTVGGIVLVGVSVMLFIASRKRNQSKMR